MKELTHPRTTIPVAVTLRHALIEVAAARQATEGQQTKAEIVYQYLTGPQFKQQLAQKDSDIQIRHKDYDAEKYGNSKRC